MCGTNEGCHGFQSWGKGSSKFKTRSTRDEGHDHSVTVLPCPSSFFPFPPLEDVWTGLILRMVSSGSRGQTV